MPIIDITGYGAQQEVQRQKALAYDKVQAQMQQAKHAKQLEEAHTMGIDDGLAAALRKMEQVPVPPADMSMSEYTGQEGISNEEVNTVAQVLGRMPDARDIQEYRRLQQLQKLGVDRDENGLAAQSIRKGM